MEAALGAPYAQWACASSISIHPSLNILRTPELGFHVRAAHDLPRHATLLSAPFSACFVASSADKLAADLARVGISPLVTAAALLTAHLAAPGNAHSALLLALPVVCNAARWRIPELPLAARHAEALPVLKRHSARWPGGRVPTAAQLELAASLLLSRGFSAAGLPGALEGTPVLCPLLDFLNHATAPNAAVRVGPRALECRALGAIRRGEEVCISYGELGDGELAWRYGFTLCKQPPPAAEERGGKRRRRDPPPLDQQPPLLFLALGNPYNTHLLQWGTVLSVTGVLAALRMPRSHEGAGPRGRGATPYEEALEALAPLVVGGGVEGEGDGEGRVGGGVELWGTAAQGEAPSLPSPLVHAVTLLMLCGELSRAQRRELAQRAVQASAGEGAAVPVAAVGSGLRQEHRKLVRAALAAILHKQIKSFERPLSEDYQWLREHSGAEGAALRERLRRQVSLGEQEIVAHLLQHLTV
jgi:hypothetical protein